MTITRRIAVAVLCLTLALACKQTSATPSSSTPATPSTPATTTTTTTTPSPASVAAALQTLATKAIYFGHQSVGANIMEGVQAVIAATPGATLRVQDTTSPSRGVFAHSGNGQNEDPKGKITAFVATIQNGAGSHVDIAFFKFCYVDFVGSTDVNSVFAEYQSKMAALKAAFPNVTFVHFTVPVSVGPAADNIPREKFSDLIRQAYAGREPLFDLAKIESTRPDGTTELVGGVRAPRPGLHERRRAPERHRPGRGRRALVTYLASL